MKVLPVLLIATAFFAVSCEKEVEVPQEPKQVLSESFIKEGYDEDVVCEIANLIYEESKEVYGLELPEYLKELLVENAITNLNDAVRIVDWLHNHNEFLDTIEESKLWEDWLQATEYSCLCR